MKKSQYQNYFAGKKITVMGLGLLGRGLGDAKFLAEMGADLIVTDLKTEEQLKTSVESLVKLKKLKPIKFVLGEHQLEDFQNRDFILKAAGVPLESIYIAEARKNNIQVKMSTSWFAKIAMDYGVKIVGITGTRGKSTVTQLIYEILKSYRGLGNIYLGGNVRGVSTLPLLKKLKKDDIVVMELDSWQLQGFGDEKISPNVAVFTTFYPDHLNYYKGDLEKYRADKENIFKFQKPGDYGIYGWEIKTKVPQDWKIKIPGAHNLQNIACAINIAEHLKIDKKIIKKVVENFKGVPGRLELVKVWKGRKFYNDTTSTTPEATRVALEALASRQSSGQVKNIILICGGADKTLDMSKLIEVLPKYCKEVIWLPGTGTDKIKSLSALREQAGLIKTERIMGSMKEAVDEAVKLSKKGDTILLSPAFASFGLFKNEFDRGEQFDKLVNKLK